MFPYSPVGKFLPFKKKDFIYLFERDQESEREWEQWRGRHRGRGRSRLSTEQGAQFRTRSQDPGIMIWAEGSCLTDSATQEPQFLPFKLKGDTNQAIPKWLYLSPLVFASKVWDSWWLEKGLPLDPVSGPITSYVSPIPLLLNGEGKMDYKYIWPLFFL